MNFRKLAAASVFLCVGVAVPTAAGAQSEFPLTGRWGYFEYGTRALAPGELDRVCMTTWDSYAPDGAFLGFEMDGRGQVSALFGGFCVAHGRQLTCHYLLDSETGPTDTIDVGDLSFDGRDIVDYVLHGEDGKPNYDDSWTYFRCPASAGFAVG